MVRCGRTCHLPPEVASSRTILPGGCSSMHVPGPRHPDPSPGEDVSRFQIEHSRLVSVLRMKVWAVVASASLLVHPDDNPEKHRQGRHIPFLSPLSFRRSAFQRIPIPCRRQPVSAICSHFATSPHRCQNPLAERETVARLPRKPFVRTRQGFDREQESSLKSQKPFRGHGNLSERGRPARKFRAMPQAPSRKHPLERFKE